MAGLLFPTAIADAAQHEADQVARNQPAPASPSSGAFSTGQPVASPFAPPTGPADTPPPYGQSYDEGYSPPQAPAASGAGGSFGGWLSNTFPNGWNGPANPTAQQNADLLSAAGQAGLQPNGTMDIRRLPIGAAGMGGGAIAPMLGGLAGSIAAPAAVNYGLEQAQHLPDTGFGGMVKTATENPYLRGAALVGAGVAGGIAGGLGAARFAAPSVEPFTAADTGTTTPEQLAANADAFQQQRETHYGGQAAGQVQRTAGEIAPGAQRPPGYAMTPDEVVAGNRAALERSGGGYGIEGANVVPDSTALVDPTSPYYDAKTDLLQRLQDLRPIQEQQAANVKALRQQQFGGLASALETASGRAGANLAMAKMAGAAEQVSFQPLSEVMSEQGINQLYDSLKTAATGGQITGGDYATAKTALDAIVDGTRVPPPSGTAALEKVFPGIQQTLKAAPINNVPPLGFAGQAKAAVGNMLQNPVEWANNTARSVETIGDVASPGRLAPTAGLYDPQTYGRSWAQTMQVMAAKDGPQAAIGRVWDSINEDPGLTFTKADGTTFALTTADFFDKDGFGLHGAGFDPYSGETVPTTGYPNLTSKLPTVRGVPGIGDNQLLPIWRQIGPPQMLRETILDRVAAGQLTPEMLQDPAVQHDLGQGIDLITGHASWVPFRGATNLVMNFGNWTAAQLEMIARAAAGTVQDPLGSANVVPGVHMPMRTSFTNDMARTAVGRLAALQTSLAVAANAAQGVSPTDKRGWKDGHAVFVINPTGGTGPQVPGFKRDTTIDTPLGAMLGHIVGIGRAAYEGATGGSRFGGNAPANAVQRVTGVAENTGSEALNWFRGTLAWVPQVLTDAFAGANMAGQKIAGGNPVSRIANTLKTDAPVPFNVSPFMGDRAKAPGAAVLGMGGVRVAEPSPAAALDNALAHNPKYGAGWYDLTPAARQAAINDPSMQPLIQARDQATSQKDTASADYMHTQQAQNTVLQGVGADLQSGKITPKQARDEYHNVVQQLKGAYDQAHSILPGQPQQGAAPTDALGKYFAVVDQNTTAGLTNWDAVDAYAAQQSPADQQVINAGTGVSGSSTSAANVVPWVKEMQAASKTIADSGYWKLADTEAQRAAQHFGLTGVQTENDLTAAIRQKILNDLGDTPQTRASLPLFESRMLAPYYSAISQDHGRFLQQHQELVPLLAKWGYGAPAKTLSQYGAQ